MKILLSHLKELMKDLTPIKNISGVEYIYATLTYIVESIDMPPEEFTEVIKENLDLEETMGMTLAKRLEQQDFEKGRALAEQLKQEGMKAGMEKERKIVAIKLFNNGMTVAEIAAITNLSISEVEALGSNSSN